MALTWSEPHAEPPTWSGPQPGKCFDVSTSTKNWQLSAHATPQNSKMPMRRVTIMRIGVRTSILLFEVLVFVMPFLWDFGFSVSSFSSRSEPRSGMDDGLRHTMPCSIRNLASTSETGGRASEVLLGVASLLGPGAGRGATLPPARSLACSSVRCGRPQSSSVLSHLPAAYL